MSIGTWDDKRIWGLICYPPWQLVQKRGVLCAWQRISDDLLHSMMSAKDGVICYYPGAGGSQKLSSDDNTQFTIARVQEVHIVAVLHLGAQYPVVDGIHCEQ